MTKNKNKKNIATLALLVAFTAPACTLEPANTSEFDSLPQDVIDELQDEDKLYGGDTQADTNNRFPGVVELRTLDGNCSATIVSPRHAITAAHCLDDGELVFVDTPAASSLPGRGTRHPSYKSNPTYDIAIITFADKEAIKREFSEIMIPIDLSDTSSYAGRKVTYVGFGKDFDGNATGERMFGTSKANTCIQGWWGVLNTFSPTICDYIGRGEASPYDGDSGGATLTLNTRGQYMLSGVISAGFKFPLVSEGMERYFGHFSKSAQVNQVLEFIAATAPEIKAAARLQ